jgi:hypothetical protein
MPSLRTSLHHFRLFEFAFVDRFGEGERAAHFADFDLRDGLHWRLILPQNQIPVFGEGDLCILVDGGGRQLALHDLQQFVGQVLAFERFERAALNAVLLDGEFSRARANNPTSS